MQFFRRSKPAFDSITVPEYVIDYRDAKKNHVLVDVRTPAEYKGGHADKAINIPLGEIANRTDELPKDKPIVVICASGNRSRTASKKLTDAGFEDVINLKGGTMAWQMNKLPIK